MALGGRPLTKKGRELLVALYRTGQGTFSYSERFSYDQRVLNGLLRRGYVYSYGTGALELTSYGESTGGYLSWLAGQVEPEGG